MITVPATFRAMPRWWHDQRGREWLDALPVLVASQCRQWDVRVDGDPLHGSNALVVPVRRRDTALVLRFAPPGDDITEAATALQLWAGRGTVRLFNVDAGSGALLLERLSSSRSLQSEPLAVAIPVIAGLVRELAVPTPIDVLSTDTIAAGHVESFERDWRALDGPTPRAQLDVAIRLADELAGVVPADLAVDGDLHCKQVLAAERAPWLVVDPVLLRGDPEYDFARVLWERLDELPKESDIMDAFEVFVRAAQVPPDRARRWIVVRSMSYLLWGIPRGLTWDPPKCRRLLDLFS
jgi:streptomycin 6-kinase